MSECRLSALIPPEEFARAALRQPSIPRRPARAICQQPRRHHLPERCRIAMKLERDKTSTTYCWTEVEFQAIIIHCRETPGLDWLARLCFTLGLTGMRISELAQLRWEDIDRDHKTTSLVDHSRQASRRKTGPVRTLKYKRNRSFPIHDELFQELAIWPRHHDGYVFHGPLGGKIKPDTVRNILIKQVLSPLKSQFTKSSEGKTFADGRLHSFRRFFCSVCANQMFPYRS
jgi:integrase